MVERIKGMAGWYGRLKDLTEELEDMGLEVLEANAEYIVVGYEDGDEDVQIMLALGGTSSTIIIAAVEEVYRV